MKSKEYNCLTVSPANFWRSKEKFFNDTDITSTMLQYPNGLSEIFMGMHIRDTGVKRYVQISRQRIITYAITLYLRSYEPKYM